jgi:hypothetical protein
MLRGVRCVQTSGPAQATRCSEVRRARQRVAIRSRLVASVGCKPMTRPLVDGRFPRHANVARDQLGTDLNPTLARPELTRFEISVRCTHSIFF